MWDILKLDKKRMQNQILNFSGYFQVCHVLKKDAPEEDKVQWKKILHQFFRQKIDRYDED